VNQETGEDTRETKSRNRGAIKKERPFSHLVRRACDLPGHGAPRREHAGVQGVLVVTGGEERPLRVPGHLRLESEYVPGGRGPNRGRRGGGGGARGGRGPDPVRRVGAEERLAEERAVRRRGSGGGAARGGRGGEVEEREVGSGSAGDEPVAVDRAGRRRGRRGRRGGVRRRGRGAGGVRGGEARVGRGGRGGRLPRHGALHRRRLLVEVVHVWWKGDGMGGFGDGEVGGDAPTYGWG
jgi:hypothetical protein